MSFQGWCCLYAISFIFFISALAKTWHPWGMSPMFKSLGLKDKAIQIWVVLGLVFLEMLISMTLFFHVHLLVSVLIAGLLLFIFIFHLLQLHFSGYRNACSCYGQWIKLKPIEAIKLDLIYLMMLSFVFYELLMAENTMGLKKTEPIVPIAIALGMMGLGKLRANR